MKVTSIDTALDHAEGIVSSGGVRRKANLSLLRDVKVGDYVVLHAGFAIEKVREAEAKKTIRLIRDL
jgi:hydrogenase expression/formation protein HypC